MPADYPVLAGVYDRIGMAEFARTMTPRLLDFAQRNGWLGRQITDLGCGTGAGLLWLAQKTYITTGIDNSPDMLQLAKQTFAAQNVPCTWLEQDIREMNRPDSADMVTALNVLPELESTREYEAVFKNVHAMLRPERWFIFDMFTIEGLVALSQGDRIEVDSDDLMIFSQNQYDYDLRMHTRRYTIFRREDGGWQRQEASRTIWAYPVGATRALVERCGYKVLHVLNPDFSRYERGKSGTTRVIIMAQKR